MASAQHTIHLQPETFAALAQEANRRKVEPDALADELVRTRLGARRREPGYLDEALAELAQLRKQMPKVDPVTVIREARTELEERGQRWRSS